MLNFEIEQIAPNKVFGKVTLPGGDTIVLMEKGKYTSELREKMIIKMKAKINE